MLSSSYCAFGYLPRCCTARLLLLTAFYVLHTTHPLTHPQSKPSGDMTSPHIHYIVITTVVIDIGIPLHSECIHHAGRICIRIWLYVNPPLSSRCSNHIIIPYHTVGPDGTKTCHVSRHLTPLGLLAGRA